MKQLRLGEQATVYTVVFLLGCSSSSTPASTSGCHSNSECPSGMACRNGSCGIIRVGAGGSETSNASGGSATTFGDGGTAAGTTLDDSCQLGCDKLNSCKLCMSAEDQCLSISDCAENCRGQGWQAAAQCLIQVSECDKARLNACLEDTPSALPTGTCGACMIAVCPTVVAACQANSSCNSFLNCLAQSTKSADARACVDGSGSTAFGAPGLNVINCIVDYCEPECEGSGLTGAGGSPGDGGAPSTGGSSSTAAGGNISTGNGGIAAAAGWLGAAGSSTVAPSIGGAVSGGRSGNGEPTSIVGGTFIAVGGTATGGTTINPCAGKTCSDHGTCTAGSCSCRTGYAGANCEICAPGYGVYPTCTLCDCSLGDVACNGTMSIYSCPDGCHTSSNTCESQCLASGYINKSSGCAYNPNSSKDGCWCPSYQTYDIQLWSFRDACADGLGQMIQLYDVSATGVVLGSWPAQFLSRYNEYYFIPLECTTGHKICWGAWQGTKYWGCGQNCTQSCTSCCSTCGTTLNIPRQSCTC